MTSKKTNPEHVDKDPQAEKHTLSRRGFLKGALIAAGSIPVLAACDSTPVGVGGSGATNPLIAPTPGPTVIPPESAYPQVPYAPRLAPDPSLLRTFTAHEARTVEALTARILPGTPDDPGAREAGVVTYIDNMLAFREGFTDKTYREPPFADIYEGEPPAPDPSFQRIWVAADEIERYGMQSLLSPREVYRLGILAVDQYARATFGNPFVQLGEIDQDSIIEDLVEDAATGFTEFAPSSFFQVLRRHTAEGMFSDPAYGGNRGLVGWQLIGFPGAQRAYTEADIHDETPQRPPQSLAQMPHFHPGEFAGNHVVLPVSGSEEQFPVHQNHP